MNNRIKEFMKQAGFDPEAIQRMGLMPNAEMFVELIVKECSSIISVTASDQLFTDKAYDRGYFDGRSDAASMIIDIFGVEDNHDS